jgi:hypothetical protein
MRLLRLCVAILAAVLVSSAADATAATVAIYVDATVAPAAFAAGEVAAAVAVAGHTSTRAGLEAIRHPVAGPCVVFAIGPQHGHLVQTGLKIPSPLRPEGFAVRRTGTAEAPVVWIVGADAGGALYGGLEVAEQIRLYGLGRIVAMERAPHLALRGVKFNLPLDVRTPSYTDMSDAAQANISEVWSLEFWHEFLDTLARHRYNLVTLWNLHPFPSLVKVAEYPEVALEDVWRSTGPFAEYYSTRATDLHAPGILDRVEVVRRLTIDQKIAFWRQVMQYGRDRNIDFQVITWNVYTYGTGKHRGITDAIDNPVTADYFRRSVASLLRTYPLLRGVGVTAGENMGTHDASFDDKEKWLFATYGQGVLDVAREQPDRPIRFIHRQHETHAQDIARTFAPLTALPNVEFVFSFKYAQAHVMSATTQPFHRGFVESLGTHRTMWTLRNDDALIFRWGAPDFVREFVRNIPVDVSRGMYYGSDMWIWGREFLSLDPETPRQLEIEKHWYNWLLWGRLTYDPELDNERLVALLGARFPGANARALFEAWQHASMIYPVTTGFHWGEFDFQWYIEGCRSRPEPARTASGFHDVNRFITLGPHPGADNISIPRFVAATRAGESLTGTTPEEVAARLHAHARAALTSLNAITPGPDRELRRTVGDIRAMALLGDYYGYKIEGATALAFFRRAGEPKRQQQAISALMRAAEAWSRFTAHATSLYRNPVWTNRVGHVDWRTLETEVARDIEIARQARPGETPPE